jgi:hypothetical protein
VENPWIYPIHNFIELFCFLLHPSSLYFQYPGSFVHMNFDNNNHVKMITILSPQTECLSDGGEDDFRGCALSACCSCPSSSLRFVAALSKGFALAKVITLLSLPTFVWTDCLEAWRGKCRDVRFRRKCSTTREMWICRCSFSIAINALGSFAEAGQRNPRVTASP